jgi:hypothetical protein
MKKITLLLSLLTFTASVYAGPVAPIQPQPVVQSETLFGPGFNVGAHALFLTPDADRADDTWGGGVNADYFFTPYVGLQGSISLADPGTDEVWQNYTVDLVFRAPFEAAHIAPYVFVGGGIIAEDDANILGRAGVGIEFRPTANFGIFADWVYNFPGGGGGDDDISDYQMIRGGIKIGL